MKPLTRRIVNERQGLRRQLMRDCHERKMQSEIEGGKKIQQVSKQLEKWNYGRGSDEIIQCVQELGTL